jgi:hypothetical protein
MRPLIWSLLLMSLLVGGCASTPVHTDGATGAVAWHAVDFQLAKTTVQGQPGERYAFTLVLSERGGTGVTLDGQPSARQLLLAQIQRMEERLNALEALVEQMPQ